MSRTRRTVAAVLGLAVVATVVAAAVPAGAGARGDRIVVHKGQSIQRAVHRAESGDVIVLKPGIYHQSVTIQTDGVRLRGSGSGVTWIVPPKTLPSNACTNFSGGSGVCVLPHGLKSDGSYGARTRDVVIQGIGFRSWPSMGVFAYGAADLDILDSTALHNGEYGFARFDTEGGRVARNRAGWSAEAGIYVGDSQAAHAQVKHNEVWGNEFGIFVRHARYVTLRANEGWDNCHGILILDDGQPGGAGNVRMLFNAMHENNRECPASDEAPPLSGGGITLVGATDSSVKYNIVRANRGDDVLSGGIVLVSAADITGGSDIHDVTVMSNVARRNAPFDIWYDGSGSGVHFAENSCGTSNPASICD